MPSVRAPVAGVAIQLVLGTGLAAAVLCVTAVGNVAVGENAYYRFPGPYVFGADARSLTPELLSLMAWLNNHAAPGETVISDRSTMKSSVSGPMPQKFNSVLPFAEAP